MGTLHLTIYEVPTRKGDVNCSLFVDSLILNLPKHRAIEIQTRSEHQQRETKTNISRSFPQTQLVSASRTSLCSRGDEISFKRSSKCGVYMQGLLTWLLSPGELLAKNKDEMKNLVDKKEKQAANYSSKSVTKKNVCSNIPYKKCEQLQIKTVCIYPNTPSPPQEK